MTRWCAVMQMVSRYQNLLHGAELVESQLKESFNEYLNAEIALRTITYVSMALSWLKGSFFYIRVRHHARCSCCCCNSCWRSTAPAQVIMPI